MCPIFWPLCTNDRISRTYVYVRVCVRVAKTLSRIAISVGALVVKPLNKKHELKSKYTKTDGKKTLIELR